MFNETETGLGIRKARDFKERFSAGFILIRQYINDLFGYIFTVVDEVKNLVVTGLWKASGCGTVSLS